MRPGAKSPLRKITFTHGLRRGRHENSLAAALEHAGGCPVLERLLCRLSSNGSGSGEKTNRDVTAQWRCKGKNGSQGWIRTTDLTGNNRPLYQLSYRGIDAISFSAVLVVQFL
jgi:hypothetical protein